MQEREVWVLDPIVRNKYRNNAVVLGEWTTASHVESAPKKTKKPAPTTPTA